MRRLIFFASLFVPALTFSVLSSAQTLVQDPARFKVAYQVQAVQGMPLRKRALLGGSVISAAKVNIRSQIGGDVIEVFGLEGDVFKKGDMLAHLEQEAIVAQRDSALAAIDAANEDLRNAGVQYSQSIVSPYSNQMFGGMPGMFSFFSDPMLRATGRGDPDFDRFANRTSKYTQYQQARTRLTQAQLKLKEAEERLEDANITAPFAGVILAKHINPGDVVQPGQTLFEFSDIQKLQVEVNVPSKLIHNLKIGEHYRVRLDIANLVVNARLAQIYPLADFNHSVKVKLDLAQGLPILPGSYAELEIFENTRQNRMPVIPESAIIWRSSLPSVFIVNPDNKTELRFVRLGEQIGELRGVLSGLKIGERIVVNPNILTVSGMNI